MKSLTSLPENRKAPTVDRPVLRYHGGKWKLAPWILGFFPPHKVYCEPYGGGASVLLRKARSQAEVYNDIDGRVVDLFRVLRDPAHAAQLRSRLLLTPFSRDDWKESCYLSEDGLEADPVDRASALLLRAWGGFGTSGMARGYSTGFRLSVRRNTSPAMDWATWPDQVPAFVERLRGVILENRPALQLFDRVDGPDALFYVDPPYLPSTRTALNRKKGRAGGCYRHEMTEQDHWALARRLQRMEGMVVLSGYHSPLYDKLYVGWDRHETKSYADGRRPRTEVVWLNRAAASRRPPQLDLIG